MRHLQQRNAGMDTRVDAFRERWNMGIVAAEGPKLLAGRGWKKKRLQHKQLR